MLSARSRRVARCPSADGLAAVFLRLLLQKCPVGVGPPTWPLPCSCRVRRILHIMRIARWITIGAVLLALTPSIAGAQDKRFHVNFGGGPTFNAGDLGDHFASGWGPPLC